MDYATKDFEEYFRWEPTGEPNKYVLVCKKNCWLNFSCLIRYDWRELKDKIPNWEYKILRTREKINKYDKEPENPLCDICIYIDTEYSQINKFNYLIYPEPEGVLMIVHTGICSLIKEKACSNSYSIGVYDITICTKYYPCKPGQPVLIYDCGEEIRYCVDFFNKKDTEAEKKKIRDKMLEKQRKKLLEKEVLDELIKEGLMFPDAEKRPHIPREVVDAVWRRDKGRCVYCGSNKELQLDHIIPFSKGGATTFENLQLLCRTCNNKKSNNIG